MKETTLKKVTIKSIFWYGGVEFIKYGDSYQLIDSEAEGMHPCLIKATRRMVYISEASIVEIEN